MWLFTPIGFFSAVKDNQNKGCVLVRARCKADIFNLYRTFATGTTGWKGKERRYSMSRPTEDVTRDYRWRTSVKKSDWAKIVHKLAMDITYDNFKSEVHRRKDQENKNNAYVQIWGVMNRVQQEENPRPQVIPGQRSFNWELERSWGAWDESNRDTANRLQREAGAITGETSETIERDSLGFPDYDPAPRYGDGV